MAIARIMLLIVAALSVVYICLYLFARDRRKTLLEEDWAKAGRPGDRDAFVRDRLTAYSGPLRRRLLFWVYAVPLSVAAVLLYTTEAGLGGP